MLLDTVHAGTLPAAAGIAGRDQAATGGDGRRYALDRSITGGSSVTVLHREIQVRLPVSRSEAGRWFADPSRVLSCIPGGRLIASSDGGGEAQLRARMGVVARSYRLTWQAAADIAADDQPTWALMLQTLDGVPVMSADLVARLLDDRPGSGPESTLLVAVAVHDAEMVPNVGDLIDRLGHAFIERVVDSLEGEPAPVAIPKSPPSQQSAEQAAHSVVAAPADTASHQHVVARWGASVIGALLLAVALGAILRRSRVQARAA